MVCKGYSQRLAFRMPIGSGLQSSMGRRSRAQNIPRARNEPFRGVRQSRRRVLKRSLRAAPTSRSTGTT